MPPKQGKSRGVSYGGGAKRADAVAQGETSGSGRAPAPQRATPAPKAPDFDPDAYDKAERLRKRGNRRFKQLEERDERRAARKPKAGR